MTNPWIQLVRLLGKMPPKKRQRVLILLNLPIWVDLGLHLAGFEPAGLWHTIIFVLLVINLGVDLIVLAAGGWWWANDDND